MNKIIPFLWFDGKAEEAATFYVSIFKNSKIVFANPMTVSFQLEYKFTPAISLFVNCETQAEVDDLWNKLLAGGRPDQCGWLQDKYGLSWQIIPTALGRMLQDKDPKKAQRTMDAMLKMSKIDIAALQQAYDGK